MIYGIEAIKLYMPAPANAKIDTNIKEESGLAEKQQTKKDEMTSVERFRQEWTQILKDLDENPESIRDVAFNGDLKTSKFRSVYWALLLRVLNADYRCWKEQRAQQRNRYEKLKTEFVKNPHDVKVIDDDPLSQSTQSVWNQYFSDQELFAVINQDVIRTFPGVDFFRKSLIQSAMSNILFYYAREHPYMCYRQGMHEILAPILFVMYGDHQALLHFKEIAATDIDPILLDVINPYFLESDTYSIFSRLMSSIESYYRITNLTQTQSGKVPNVQNSNVVTTEVEVISQLNSIRDKILAKEDLHLHNHLLKLDISLHIFGIRWLRLLFGREFPLLDLLVLWDAIFADSDRFDLPNYVLVAMLIRIRNKLLLSDYTTCLTYLMRYPSNEDINLVLRHALHMQMPNKFECPPNAIVYFAMKSFDESLPGTLSNLPKSKNRPAGVVTRKQESSLAKDKTLAELQERTRSISLSDSVATVEKRITQLQVRNAADSAALERLRIGIHESDKVIMDGFSDNSPELLRLELANAQTVITIARNKLQAYLSTVRKHIGKSKSDELAQSLDGIEELCSFLDVKFMFPHHTRIRKAPIDQAFEADEQQQRLNLKTAAKSSSITEAASEAESLKHNNVINPSASKAEQMTDVSGSTAYEKPDNGFMFNSARLLGNLKEIELIPIISDEKIVEPLDVKQSTSMKLHKTASSSSSLGVGSGLPIPDPLKLQQTE